MFKTLSISFTFLCVAVLMQSQSTGANQIGFGDGDELIRWDRQYPDEHVKEKRSFFQKFGDLVLGVKPERISKPVSLVPDGKGAIWVLSQENGLLLKMNDVGSVSLTDEVLKTHQIFPSLVAVCRLPDGEILFTDSYLNSAFIVSENNRSIKSFNTDHQLAQPTGIAYSKYKDQVWIIETGEHRISVFDSRGKYVRSIGQRGAENGQFNFPTHLWIDDQGKVYVVDAMNFRIQIFDEEGNFLSRFGKSGDATGSLARPKGIATDSHGNIYIADALFNTVQIFNDQGEFLYYFGSRGSDKGQFWMPSGIYIDEADYIYVSDSYNNRVQVFLLLKEE